jgi:hypothetical protein
VKADLLQLRQRAGSPGNENDTIDQMIGQFRGQRGKGKLSGLLPSLMSAAACSQMALWQAMNTTPRRISAGMELSSPEKGPFGFS